MWKRAHIEVWTKNKTKKDLLNTLELWEKVIDLITNPKEKRFEPQE